MLIVELPSGKIGIVFKHKIFARPLLDERVCKRFQNGQTLCDIYKFAPLNGIALYLRASGVAICKSPDHFNKRLGRKRALTSALAKKIGTGYIYTREEREMIWRTYWMSQTPQDNQPIPPAVDNAVGLGESQVDNSICMGE